ncbi:hypothetical protein MKX01_036580, partial [Papaver californicum]
MHHILYDSSKCPFISEGLDCVDNGRPNKDYLKYRWSPTGCDALKFDGLDMVKRCHRSTCCLVHAAFCCLVHAAIPNAKYTNAFGVKMLPINFTDPEYDISIIFNQKPFLVEFEDAERVLKIDTICTGGVWKVVVFNTWHWWHHTGRLQ